MNAFSESGAIAMIERNEAQKHRLLDVNDHEGGGSPDIGHGPAGSIAKPPNSGGDGPGRDGPARDGHQNGR